MKLAFRLSCLALAWLACSGCDKITGLSELEPTQKPKATGPSPYFTTVLGGPGDEHVAGVVATPPPDGSFVFGGSSDGYLGENVENAFGGADALAVFFNTTGGQMGATRFGPDDDQAVTAVNVSDKSVAVAGTFSGSLKGPDGIAHPSSGGSDGFIAVFTLQGQLSWIKTFGGPGDDVVSGLASRIDNTDHEIFFVAGSYHGAFKVDQASLANTGTGWRAYLLSILGNGTNNMALRGFDFPMNSTNDESRATGIATDVNGNPIAVGTFTGGIVLPNAPCNLATLKSAGSADTDGFVIKLSPDFECARATGLHTDEPDSLTAVKVTKGYPEHTVVAGTAAAAGSFAGQCAQPLGKPSAGNHVVLAALDTSLVCVWQAEFAAEPGSTPNAIAVQPGTGDPAIVVGGEFGSSIDFGGGPLPAKGDASAFLVGFGSEGKHLWSRAFGSAGKATIKGVAIDFQGDIVIGAEVNQATSFGAEPLGGYGGYDAILAKLRP